MKKILTFLIADVIFVSGCNADLVDIADKKSEYISRLGKIREALFGDTSVGVCCKEKLATVCTELGKKETNFKQVASHVFSVLPDISDSDAVYLLNKIVVFSVFHLLKKGKYDFVEASFYPEEKDLLDVKIGGQSPTTDEFCEIQETLQRKLEDEGSLPETPVAFEDAVKAIIKKRPKLAPERVCVQVRPKSSGAKFRAKTTDDLPDLNY